MAIRDVGERVGIDHVAVDSPSSDESHGSVDQGALQRATDVLGLVTRGSTPAGGCRVSVSMTC